MTTRKIALQTRTEVQLSVDALAVRDNRESPAALAAGRGV